MYRSAYLILMALPLMFCSVGIYLGIRAWISPPTSENPIAISKSTTWVTDHVDENGFIDYEEAINEGQSRGKSPDQNAAAGLVRVFGLTSLSESTRYQYLQDFQATASEFASSDDQLRDGKEYVGNLLELAQGQSASELLSKLNARPWSRNAQDAAGINEWLAKNDLPVRAALEAIDLPDFYFPLHRAAESEWLLAGTQQFLRKCQELSMLLNIRAMRALGESDIEGAVHDSLAIRKLARKLSEGVTPFELIVSNEIELKAIVIEKAILNNQATTAAQLTAYRDQLQSLQPRGRMEEKLDSGLRMLMLDLVNRIAKQKHTQSDSEEQRRPRRDEFSLFRKLDVDFEEAMRQLNMRLDQVIRAIQQPCVQGQLAAFGQIDVRPPQRPGLSMITGLLMRSRGARGQMLADIVLGYMLPNQGASLLKENALIAYDRLIPLAFTLQARSKNGQSCPASVADLVPRVVAEIPLSPLDLSPAEYEKTESGFKLQFSEPIGWQLPIQIELPIVVVGQPER